MNIKELFRWKPAPKKEEELHNVHHPDFAGQVEPVFKVQGIQYYRFAKETSMRWGRYMYLQTFLYEKDLRIDQELLLGYVSLIEKAISGNAKFKNGTQGIDLKTVYDICTNLRARIDLGFEVSTTYRLASVVYFDENEDLYGYDKAYNDERKIKPWMEGKVVDFFYTLPTSELLGLNDLSETDLRTFIQSRVDLLETLAVKPTFET